MKYKAADRARGTHIPAVLFTDRMGIVSCCDESAGYLRNDPQIEKHFSEEWQHSIPNATQRVLKMSRDENIGAGQAAQRCANYYCMLFSHDIKELNVVCI